MGHKVHPTGIRLGISKDWGARWYAERKDFADNLNSDLAARRFIEKELSQAAVSHVHIERPAKQAQVTIYTARPGIVIGKKGEDIERLRRKLTDLLGVPTAVSVSEIRKPELDAKLVADSIAQQLERRIMFRRAMKRAVGNAMRLGAQGIKVQVGGRLNGADIARTEDAQRRALMVLVEPARGIGDAHDERTARQPEAKGHQGARHRFESRREAEIEAHLTGRRRD